MPDSRHITISHHAKLRYLQRIDSNEPFPGGPISRAVADGQLVDDPDVEADDLRAIEGNGIRVVMTRGFDRVVTILPEVAHV